MNCQGLETSSKRKFVLNYHKKLYQMFKKIHIFSFNKYTRTDFNLFITLTSQIKEEGSIWFNNKFGFNIHRVTTDFESNLLAIDLKIEDNKVILIYIYDPNTDNPDLKGNIRKRFFRILWWIFCVVWKFQSCIKSLARYL